MSRLEFPSGFLWGSSTSAHQVEGDNKNSDWWVWEHSQKRAEELRKQNKNFQDYYSGIACDFYNRYEQDFDIAKELNHNAQRISIEWARIQPTKDFFDQNAMEHYRRVLAALKKRGMRTFVTLHHFTNPIWFSQLGGWENKDNIELFLDYAKKVVLDLGSMIDFICVINEPDLYAGMAYAQGFFPPQKRSWFLAGKVQKNLISAHIQFYKVAKGIIYECGYVCQIGTAQHVMKIKALGFLKFFTYFIEKAVYLNFLDKTAACSDFIGINYYTRHSIKFSWRYPFIRNIEIEPGTLLTDFGWEVYPQGFLYLLRQIKKYNKPIYITENGAADAEDKLRKDFICQHLKFLHQAISEGIPVQGYLHWSLLDNFEWAHGYEMKFGLVEIERQNGLRRKIRDSAYYYADICKNNYLEI